MSSILEVKNLTKTYPSGDHQLTVLENINMHIDKGETCAIVGPSGSGKTTLLGLCAGLDRASSGSVILNGITLDHLNEDQRAEVRGRHVGFIFQSFNLMPTLTALENVMVPLELRGQDHAADVAIDLLDKVGLAKRKNHFPTQLSGGEQQRVSIARAFSNQPDILFADEPTGNLDEETGIHIEQLIFDLNRDAGTTLVLVTHDMNLASKTQRVISIKGGTIARDIRTQKASSKSA